MDCWGQSFGYDRYGNLTTINSTKCSSPTMSVTVNAKNQVTNSGFTYDNGGRLTADGTSTYAWVAKGLPVVRHGGRRLAGGETARTTSLPRMA